MIIALLRLIPRAGAMTAKRVARVLPPTPDGIEAPAACSERRAVRLPDGDGLRTRASALDERAVAARLESRSGRSPIR